MKFEQEELYSLLRACDYNIRALWGPTDSRLIPGMDDSTATCLCQFHNDSSLISHPLCESTMQSHRSDETKPFERISQYHPSQIYLNSVVNKLISSIWLNAVNSHHETIKAPEEMT